jgi:hypothetical protein
VEFLTPDGTWEPAPTEDDTVTATGGGRRLKSQTTDYVCRAVAAAEGVNWYSSGQNCANASCAKCCIKRTRVDDDDDHDDDDDNDEDDY